MRAAVVGKLLGAVGRVVATTRGDEGPGKVNVGGQLYSAWSSRSLPVGARVLVIEVRPDTRSVRVEPWMGE